MWDRCWFKWDEIIVQTDKYGTAGYPTHLRTTHRGPKLTFSGYGRKIDFNFEHVWVKFQKTNKKLSFIYNTDIFLSKFDKYKLQSINCAHKKRKETFLNSENLKFFSEYGFFASCMTGIEKNITLFQRFFVFKGLVKTHFRTK